MKLLIINPNISAGVTALIEQEALRAASADTAITALTVDSGVAYIETPAEAAVAGYATLALLAEHCEGHDAAIVAAFGDPCIMEAKEILPIPVVGLTESALASAFLLGGRFAIVGISRRIGAWYMNTVEAMGMGARFLGYRGLGSAFSDIATVQHEAEQTLVRMCLDCVEEGADAIILAGAPLAGLARSVSGRVPVPLIDGVGSAVRMAEVMARSGYVRRTQGAFTLPPEKDHKGLPSALSRLIGRKGVA